jgi:chromosome segregation ATPase
MRSTALARKVEYDEVPVSSIEVLETNVVGIRTDLNELKTDFRAAVARLDTDVKAAVARLDSDIKAAVTKLETEIRAAAAKAASDLDKFATRIEAQHAEFRADQKALRDKVDAIGSEVKDLGSKLNAMFWALGGIATLIIVATGVITAVR